MARTKTLTVKLRTPHEKQRGFIESIAKRIVVRAGRRSGKTTGVSMYAVDRYLDGKRVLYAAPTQDQTDKFWFEIVSALEQPIKAGVYKVNQTRRFVERPGTQNRIRAKTAWDVNSMRGDFADELIFEEYQLMKPDVWEKVGAPMLLDNNGNAIFIYTPEEGEKGAHARQMYKKAKNDTTGRWEAFHFTSYDNPYLSKIALDEITDDMDELAVRMEILAEDLEQNPSALWDREMIVKSRWKGEIPDLAYVVVAVDPAAGPGEHGIIVGGRRKMDDGLMHAFIKADHTMKGKPGAWGNRVVTVYNQHLADKVIGEVNNGGDMVENTVKVIDTTVPFKQVRASRGKMTRAEPVAALYKEGRVHHCGVLEKLEDQLVNWVPGSGGKVDRLDSLVWCVSELLLGPRGWSRGVAA